MTAQGKNICLRRRHDTREIVFVHQRDQSVFVVQHENNPPAKTLMECWRDGVMGKKDFGPVLQYSTTPSPHCSYLHGLGSSGFTATSNNAGPGCASARSTAPGKPRGSITCSP